MIDCFTAGTLLSAAKIPVKTVILGLSEGSIGISTKTPPKTLKKLKNAISQLFILKTPPFFHFF